jgi:hypothetical protein
MASHRPNKTHSYLLAYMPSSSNLATKQWGKVDKAVLHKLVNYAGISQDAVKAAIGKHNHGQQWDEMGGGGGGEVGNTTKSACLMTTAMMMNMTTMTKQ